MDWCKLPNEVLNNIIARLDDKSKSQCSLTCRQWKCTAYYFLFEKVTLKSKEDIEKLLNVLSIYQSDMCIHGFSRSPANLIKTLNCKYTGHFDGLLAPLSSVLPYVEYINTEYISDFGKELYSLLKEGKFPCLKEIPYAVLDWPLPELMLSRKEYLERLRIDVRFPDNDPTQILHLLPKLKTLQLTTFEELHLERLSPTPQLKSFALTYFANRGTVGAWPLDVDSIKPFPNAREVYVSYEHCFRDNQFLLYIMKKFPYLDKLELRDNKSGQYARYNGLTPTLACFNQLLKYFFTVKKFSFADSILTEQFTSRVVQDFLKYLFNRKSVHENVTVPFSVIFEAFESGWGYDPPSDHSAFISVANSRENGTSSCLLSVHYRIKANTFSSHLDLYQNVKNMNIETLTIAYRAKYGNSFRFGSFVPVILDVVFNHFPKLKIFHLKKITHVLCCVEKRVVLENLNNNVKEIHFKDCILSGHLFPWISATCPNLETLSLIKCRYAIESSGHFDITMPSTRLQNLKVDIELITGQFNYAKVFIKLTTSKKKPRFCKIVANYDIDFGQVIFPEKDCTEDYFNLCLDDKKCAVFDIHCDAVTKLDVIGRACFNEFEERYGYNEGEYVEVNY